MLRGDQPIAQVWATVSVTAAAWPSGDGPGEWLAPALDAFFSRWPVGERGVFIGGH
jgi:hypothetical protein